MSVAITIDNVTKKYDDKTIIDQLSLKIHPGEFFTLLGPSGCGKTTLLRMIIGFNSIEGGEIRIDNEVINDVPVSKRNMGMVFQNYAIFPHMSVKDNVAFGLKNKKLPKEEIEKRVDEMLEIVKIKEYKDRMPDQLSGGQQQRVALARAIVIHPQVLLMDEPLSNLDAKLRIDMRNAIKSIQQQVGITTVYVTHDQEEALAVSDRIAVMNKGKIQQIGTPQEIYTRPANIFVSNFIGTSNFIPATIKKEASGNFVVFNHHYRVQMDNLVEHVEDGQEVIVSVRPHEFMINENGEGLKGTVKSSMFLGMNVHYFVELENGQEVEAVQDTENTRMLSKGTTVHLTVKEKKINVYDRKDEMTLIQKGDSDAGY